MLPLKNSTTFLSWEAIDYETYCKYGFTQPVVQNESVSVKDMVFRAILQRGRGMSKLQMYARIIIFQCNLYD